MRMRSSWCRSCMLVSVIIASCAAWPSNVTVLPPGGGNLNSCGDNTTLLPHPRLLRQESLKRLAGPWPLERRVAFNLTLEEFMTELLQRRSGTFLESGGHDGCIFSHTIGLEKMKWKGVLIEPAPELFAQLVRLNRSVWTVNAAIAVDGNVSSMNFLLAGGFGGFSQYMTWKGPRGSSQASVTAVPLPRILRRVGLPRVDLWVLDVEGAEPNILQSLVDSGTGIPARVVFVEHNSKRHNRIAIQTVLKAAGFSRILALQQDDWYVSAEVCAQMDCGEYTDFFTLPWRPGTAKRMGRIRGRR
eukprot:Hpha_TRINITY_DN31009_c0_g1::TRINITY_DN31009_c0_g1_i1::g.64015::m.64015